MQISQIAGLLLTFGMGMSLGLIGAGGSILTVPILVYLFAIPAPQATGWSLPIVGCVAAIGAWLSARKGDLDSRASFQFGVASVAAAFTVRRFLLPSIPSSIGPVAKDTVLLVLFAITMLVTATVMIRSKKVATPVRGSVARWVGAGVAAGALTGLLGAGGGFLILPVLTMVMGLPTRSAVGSSLAIIAMNAGAAWLADLQVSGPPDWRIVSPILLVAILGMFAGVRLRTRVPASALKPIFGWFVATVGCFVLVREIFFH